MNTAIEVKMAKMETDIQYIKKGQDQNAAEHKQLRQMIQDFINSSDKRYAFKNVEKIVYGLIFVVVAGVITLVLNLI